MRKERSFAGIVTISSNDPQGSVSREQVILGGKFLDDLAESVRLCLRHPSLAQCLSEALVAGSLAGMVARRCGAKSRDCE